MADKQNYDKILMISGIVLGLGVAGMGVYSFLGLNDQLAVRGGLTDKNITAPAGIKEASSIHAAIADTETYTLSPIQQKTQTYVGFVAPELWVKLGDKEPFDILSGPNLHGEVPNKWFLDNGLKDIIIYSDALTRDPDDDGFTVLEEYLAGTNPVDPASHPLLVSKLLVNEIKQSGFYLTFSQSDGEEFTFKALTPKQQEMWKNTVKKGEAFGSRKGSNDKPRFQLEKIEQKQFKDEKLDTVDTSDVAFVKDMKATKDGQIYEIRQGSKYPIKVIDKKVILTISAGSAPNSNITVEEGADFRIPGDDEHTYTLKSIDNASQTAIISDKTNGEQIKITRQK